MRSMTGYGKGAAAGDGVEITVELKAVNNRFLDVNLRLGKGFLFLEDSFRSIISSFIKRGTVDVFFNYAFVNKPSKKLTADIATINEYALIASEVSKETGVTNNLSFSDLLRLDLIKADAETIDNELLTSLSTKAVEQALKNLDEMRKAEGNALKTDLSRLLGLFEGYMKDAEYRAPFVIDEYRNKLKQRIDEALGASMDEMRLLTECAVFADKSDINEEFKRLDSHISQFENALESDEPQGRRLEFLLQEMGRETNTMGSKSTDIEISKAVIEMKDVLEKLKEQVRNAE